MNKAQLVEAIVKETGLKKKDAEAALSAVLNSIENALAAGDKVQLVGFGTFSVKERAARVGRNPHNGQSIQIPASKHPSFAAGSALKASVNK